MKKISLQFGFLLMVLTTLCGCAAIGDKSMSLSVAYIATTVLSLLFLIGYLSMTRNKDPWFLLLFSSVFVINVGYMALSLSTTISEALLANRISYLGSAFLILSMIIIICNVSGITIKKSIIGLLTAVSTFVFLVTATPGYLDIYYRSVTLETVNGITVLNKVYGPWHKLYLFYLLAYFFTMILVVVYATVKKKIPSIIYSVSLLAATLANFAVWLLEQLVKIDFEFLSVSYIITELFLLCLYLLQQEHHPASPADHDPKPIEAELPAEAEVLLSEQPETLDENQQFLASCQYLFSQLKSLTPTEHTIYEYYLSGKSSKEIMETLNIKENTLKYHNKNIYSKLGVSSRKQLLKIAEALREQTE